MDIIKELEACFNTELVYLKVGLDRETDPIKRNDMAWYCVQRLLGATQFANQLGADYGTVEAMFEGYKEKIAKMENGA